jgi:hypothetical protein
MLRATRRYLGSPAWLAVGLVVLLPALAEAQLFPNRTLNRQRTPCAAESPFNAQVRHDYFGYYPTCWQRFPAGWGCPGFNPELPNVDASIRRLPLKENRNPAGEGLGPDEANPDMPGEGAPNNMPGEDPNIPPVPNPGRSPFELDAPGPRPTNPRPADRDPFDAPAPTTPRPGTPPPPPSGRAIPPTGLMEMPTLPATAPTASAESNLSPGTMVMVPEAEATLASNSNPASSRPDLGPLPTLPDPSATSRSIGIAETQPSPYTPAPAQAPRRRGILGGLFGARSSQNR